MRGQYCGRLGCDAFAAAAAAAGNNDDDGDITPTACARILQ